MAEFNIAGLDKNLAVEVKVEAEALCLHDVRKAPFELYGLYNPKEEPEFKRMPDDVAAATSAGVKRLARHTAGGRLRFSTDSPYVVLKAVMPSITHMPHMPLSGTSGFDLYIDSADGRESVYFKTFMPPAAMTDGYESKIDFTTEGVHYVTIHFPLYNTLTDLYIGVKEGSYLGEGAKYRDKKPIIYYGSSITQGGCASRPGNAYTNRVTRTLGIDHVNLGFSGNGKGEDPMIEYLASLEMSAFVSDYDHNANTPERLTATHKKLYEAVRAKHPDVPYIIMSRPDIRVDRGLNDDFQKNINCRRVIFETYHYARDIGDRNVYLIDGEGIFRGPYEDSCAVDGVHPNDLGFALMADAVECVLRRVLRNGKM